MSGNLILEDVLKTLAQPFKNNSQSLPEDKYLMLTGLLYNFAIKYAKLSCSKHEKSLLNFVEAVKTNSHKNRNSFNRGSEGFLYTFNEKNWPEFKALLNSGGAINNTIEFKTFKVKHKSGDNDVFNLITSQDNAYAIEVFSKPVNNLQSLQPKKSAPRRKSKTP